MQQAVAALSAAAELMKPDRLPDDDKHTGEISQSLIPASHLHMPLSPHFTAK